MITEVCKIEKKLVDSPYVHTRSGTILAARPLSFIDKVVPLQDILFTIRVRNGGMPDRFTICQYGTVRLLLGRTGWFKYDRDKL